MPNVSGRTKAGQKAKDIRKKVKQKLLDNRTVEQICADHDFCPFTETIKLIRETTSQYVKSQCLIDLQKYVRPTLKSLEIKQSKTDPFIFNINI